MAHFRPTRRLEKALPRRGRVLVNGAMYRITFIMPQAGGSFAYTLTEVDPPHRVIHNAAHDELIAQLAKHARYNVGQQVLLAASAPMIITKRQWDFRTGTVWYYAAVPNRTIGAGWFKQETVMRLDRELDPTQDTDVEPTPLARSSPPPDWL